MSNLIKKLLSGFTNTTSKESEEKEKKMLNIKTNIAILDKENNNLFRASQVLEGMGNGPGLSADEFYKHLASSEFPAEDFQDVTLAAIAIETMMAVDLTPIDDPYNPYKEPTIH
jgi:hypothetical protein